jgi:hypothetical protein
MPHQQDLEKFASLSEPQKRYTKVSMMVIISIL